MDGNTPQWDDIISGEWNEEDSDSPHRHIKDPDTFGHVLQLVTGTAFLLAIVAIWFPRGIVVLPFLALGCYPLMMGLWKNPLAAPTRIGAMGQICSVNVALGAFYAAALLL